MVEEERGEEQVADAFCGRLIASLLFFFRSKEINFPDLLFSLSPRNNNTIRKRNSRSSFG